MTDWILKSKIVWYHQKPEKMLIASSTASTINFHQFPNGELIHSYSPKCAAKIQSISWCKGGSWLALLPHPGILELITVKDQLKLLQTIDGGAVVSNMSCISFEKNTKKNIALGTENGLVLVYDMKSRTVKKSFPPSPSSLITHVEFTAKDSHIVVASRGYNNNNNNGNVMLYSNTVKTSDSVMLDMPQSNINNTIISALRTSPTRQSSYVVAGSNNGLVIVWDTITSKRIFALNQHHDVAVTDVSLSPINSDLVVSTGLDRQFCFRDVLGNACIATIPVRNSMTGVDFSPDGTYLAMSSQTGKIYIYDTRRLKTPVKSFPSHNKAVRHLAFQLNYHETRDDNSTSSSICNRKININDTPTFFARVTTIGNKMMSSSTSFQSTQITDQESLTKVNTLSKDLTADADGDCTNTNNNEVKQLLEEFRNEIKYSLTDSACQMRQICLGMQMSMVRQFIKMEDYLKGLKNALVQNAAPFRRQIDGKALFEENLMLKKKLAIVEQELKNIKNKITPVKTTNLCCNQIR